MNRLQGLAGMGQSAASGVAQQGGQLISNAGQIMNQGISGAGASTASGIQAAGNATANAYGGIASFLGGNAFNSSNNGQPSGGQQSLLSSIFG